MVSCQFSSQAKRNGERGMRWRLCWAPLQIFVCPFLTPMRAGGRGNIDGRWREAWKYTGERPPLQSWRRHSVPYLLMWEAHVFCKRRGEAEGALAAILERRKEGGRGGGKEEKEYRARQAARLDEGFHAFSPPVLNCSVGFLVRRTSRWSMGCLRSQSRARTKLATPSSHMRPIKSLSPLRRTLRS
jgi:hypothetical protein